MRSLGGGLLGGLAGGMLFHSLFGGSAAQSGTGAAGATGKGGIGLMDILLLAGIAYLIYWYIKKKRTEASATAGYYQSSGNVELPPQPQYPPVYDSAPGRGCRGATRTWSGAWPTSGNTTPGSTKPNSRNGARIPSLRSRGPGPTGI